MKNSIWEEVDRYFSKTLQKVKENHLQNHKALQSSLIQCFCLCKAFLLTLQRMKMQKIRVEYISLFEKTIFLVVFKLVFLFQVRLQEPTRWVIFVFGILFSPSPPVLVGFFLHFKSIFK